ncbi:hypothetical protein [Paenibacillus herberti]|uniref:Uncharacterized protein n=1 Tax=Paenibacillus herberti TaxID=1619309 RepID=A0A229P5G8_9BACL|nr:hypothetical protein [Paenibacillus herberti]OXM17368.1 hypothetical protein CGZ75_12430 [Paenibacillus herberti]
MEYILILPKIVSIKEIFFEMNRMMKFATTATMAVTLLVSGSSAFANENASPASPAPSPSLVTPTKIGIFDTSNVIFNAALKDGLKSSFDIPKGYGWVKVWVKNTTNAEMTVRVTQGSLTGKEKMNFKVPANSQVSVDGTAAWSTGDFHVAISTENSEALTGLLSVKLATTQGEL